MHPAFSIVVFTTLSGLGYGLAAALGLGVLDPAAPATKVAHVLALIVIAAGLVSSTLHLGNPQRAWRAFSQWRTSWLSREGVMAVLTFLPLLCSAGASIVDDRYLVVPGLLGTVMCAGTVYCTAMIYGSIKAIDAWYTPLTPVCYLMFSAAGGLLSASAFAMISGNGSWRLAAAALVATAAAWAIKAAWRRRLKTVPSTSSPESATGLGFIGKVRQFERPHSNENYLTREMGYRVAHKHASKLAVIAFALGGAMPSLLLVAGLLLGANIAVAVPVAALILVSYLAGMVVERWLFFAEGRHAVMNYYGG